MSLGRIITIGAIGTAAVLANAGTASATLYSFASDDDSNFLTFRGTSGSGGSFQLSNGRTPLPTPVTLDVDDDNGLAPTAHLPVGMIVNLTATYVTSSPFGSAWTHIYNISGSYSFVHPTTGQHLLDVQVNPGAASMNIVGSPTSWGSAGSITGSDAASGGLNGVNYSAPGLTSYMISQGLNPFLYGVDNFAFVLEDFAFTMTSITADGGAVALDAGHLPTTSWGSEASHSGHALGVPAPGAAALAGVFGLTMGRRRTRK